MSRVYKCGWCTEDCDGSILDEEDDPICAKCKAVPGPKSEPAKPMIKHSKLTLLGKSNVVACVTKHGWRMKKVAAELDVSYQSLYRWLSHNAVEEMKKARADGLLNLSRPVYAITSSREAILDALRETGGNIAQAAKNHNVQQPTLVKAMQRLVPKEYEAIKASRRSNGRTA